MIITCPHCAEIIWIDEINCGIFRHGILKSNLIQIDPMLNIQFYILTGS